MKDDEVKVFVERSMYFGALIAVLFILPMSITSAGAYVIIAFYGGSIAFALIPCVWFLVSLAFVPRILKKNKELLCSTAWATEQGLKPDRLKVFSFRAGGQ